MLGDPRTGSGFISWVLLGFGGAVVALLVAYLFPSFIPTQVTATKL